MEPDLKKLEGGEVGLDPERRVGSWNEARPRVAGGGGLDMGLCPPPPSLSFLTGNLLVNE